MMSLVKFFFHLLWRESYKNKRLDSQHPNLFSCDCEWFYRQVMLCETENGEHIANPPSAWVGNKDITELICRRMLLFNVISNKPFIKFIAAPDTHSCVPACKFSQNRLSPELLEALHTRLQQTARNGGWKLQGGN